MKMYYTLGIAIERYFNSKYVLLKWVLEWMSSIFLMVGYHFQGLTNFLITTRNNFPVYCVFLKIDLFIWN